MRRGLKAASWVLAAGLAAGLAACGGSDDSGSLPGTVIDRQTVDVGGGVSKTLTLGSGDKAATLNFPPDATLMKAPVDVALLSGVDKAGAMPANGTAVQVITVNIMFTMPATLQETLPPPPVGESYYAAEAGAGDGAWTIVGVARDDGPATTTDGGAVGQELYEIDVKGTGLWSIVLLPTRLDGGVTNPDGGTAGTNGNDGGTGGSGGGVAINTCPSAQTQFGNIAMGDSNPSFTSGLGVQSGAQLYVFSAYVGPPTGAVPDGGADIVSSVYVQAFDATSGASAGPAAPLFDTVQSVAPFIIEGVSVAPTGEMVILHSHEPGNANIATQLYATFLAPPVAVDAGAPALTVRRTVQLESVYAAEPQVIWSVASQAFVISWKYYNVNWYTRVRKFLTDGRSAGGDTSIVPTRAGLDNDYTWADGHVGTSGAFLGVGHRDYSTGVPVLTILDADGLQVGDFVQLDDMGVSHSVSVGGTTKGFVALYDRGNSFVGTFVPINATGGVSVDAGAPSDAGAVAAPFSSFTFPSNAGTVRMASDDTGGAGGVGAVFLEANGANFLYVLADGSKHLNTGTVISSAKGKYVGIANYHGSFSVSLFDSAQHNTQVVVSGCR